MLKVKLLHENAKSPTVAHPGDDLGYDLYALEDTLLPYGIATAVATGVSARFYLTNGDRKFGLMIRDRSSMAINGIKNSAGVVDAGYTGELKVIMTSSRLQHRSSERFIPVGYYVRAGDKIAQMVPTEVFTSEPVVVVDELEEISRGVGGFGSTGA